MQEGSVLNEFAPLFSEVKRRLHNRDEDSVWQETLQEFVRGLAVKDANQPGGLPPQLDAIWHECLLNTKQYRALCQRVRGQFLEHTTLSEQDDETERLSRIDETVHNYRKRFREEPRSRLWEEAPPIERPEGSYQIFVRNNRGTTLTFEVFAHTTYLQLKHMIADKEGIPVDHQRLIYAGRQDNDAKTMWDADVTKWSTLHLVMRVCGC